MFRSFVRVVVVSLVGLLLASAASGQTIWYVDALNCPGPGSGTPADPFCKIQDAINAAAPSATPPDEIRVADGTYTGSGNKNLDFGGKIIALRSASGNPTACIIDCEGSGRGFYFHSGEGPGSVVQGLTIRSGFTDYSGGVYCRNGSSPTLTDCTISGNTAVGADIVTGGGVSCDSSSPTLTNCTISDNTASNGGGGLGCRNSSSLTLSNCTISGNTATGGTKVYGGGVYCDSSSLTLAGCTVSGNTTAGSGRSYGGGVYCGSASLTLTDCTISGNTTTAGGSAYGGGVYCTNSTASLTNCTMDRNSAAASTGTSGGSGNGGGLSCDGYTILILTDCMIRWNATLGKAGGFGAGVYFYGSNPGSSATLTHCTIGGNTATGHASWSSAYGGGVALSDSISIATLTDCVISGNSTDAGSTSGSGVYSASPGLTMINCTATGNTADAMTHSDGGGVFCAAGSSLINCTITGNVCHHTPWGGGVSCSNSTLTNCIIWGNTQPEIQSVNGSVLTYCDVRGGFPGTGNIDADPLFIDPDGSDNDPATWEDNDYRLSAGSPCIDAGDNAAVPAGITTDLDGLPRFVDDLATPDTGVGTPPIVDLGAYEFRDNAGACCVEGSCTVTLQQDCTGDWSEGVACSTDICPPTPSSDADAYTPAACGMGTCGVGACPLLVLLGLLNPRFRSWLRRRCHVPTDARSPH